MTTLTKEHIYKNPIGLTQQFRQNVLTRYIFFVKMKSR